MPYYNSYKCFVFLAIVAVSSISLTENVYSKENNPYFKNSKLNNNYARYEYITIISEFTWDNEIISDEKLSKIMKLFNVVKFAENCTDYHYVLHVNEIISIRKKIINHKINAFDIVSKLYRCPNAQIFLSLLTAKRVLTDVILHDIEFDEKNRIKILDFIKHHDLYRNPLALYVISMLIKLEIVNIADHDSHYIALQRAAEAGSRNALVELGSLAIKGDRRARSVFLQVRNFKNISIYSNVICLALNSAACSAMPYVFSTEFTALAKIFKAGIEDKRDPMRAVYYGWISELRLCIES